MDTTNSENPSRRCGWSGAISTFLDTEISCWLDELKQHYKRVALEAPGTSQMFAWRNCYDALQSELRHLTTLQASSADWYLVFEYELPRERGRRPDLVILTSSQVLVLEFKEHGHIEVADLDQVNAYARDIRNYHAASHGRDVTPILVLMALTGAVSRKDGVVICPPDHLATLLDDLADRKTGPRIFPDSWLSADYAPLPSLITAARLLFKNEPLPAIRRAHSAGVPDTVAALISIAQAAKTTGDRRLALVTGIPGAGKTLVGLTFVHEYTSSEASSSRDAVFLSGNGPLITVLQYVLKSKVFVQDIHGFLKEYGGEQTRSPEEHIWIYDEAQRAWDSQRVLDKRGHNTSEPEDFMRLGERPGDWAMIIGLIGEGQEIHIGEEAGIGQWDEAIAAVGGNWVVHCPGKLQSLFPHARQTIVDDNLSLTESLRTHLAEDVNRWIEYVLEGEIQEAAALAPKIRGQGFDMYLTRKWSDASDYVSSRYAGQVDKRFGVIASSKAKNLVAYDIRNDWNFTRRLRVGPWYADDPTSEKSSCQLHDVATEFSCQGLELDFPIVAWGDDLRWMWDGWVSPAQRRSKAHDPHHLRINSYRVLLSRGRDGFAIFVPPDASMDATYTILHQAGITELR